MNLPRRPRRLRRSEAIRGLVRETRVHPNQLVLPVFVHEGLEDEVIASMPGVLCHSIASAIRAAQHAMSVGVNTFAL
ncbi:MAG: porphobilinogen synthase, partial [Planctomycetota bacterium]